MYNFLYGICDLILGKAEATKKIQFYLLQKRFVQIHTVLSYAMLSGGYTMEYPMNHLSFLVYTLAFW